MKKDSLSIIHKSYNSFFDIEDNEFYKSLRFKKFTTLSKSFTSLSNRIKDEDTIIINMYEYKVMLWKAFNKMMKIKDIVLYEPADSNFDDDFYQEKYLQIGKLKLNLIKHIN